MIAPTPEEVRQITKDVLARPEFLSTPTWTQLLLDRALQWLREVANWSGRNPQLSKLLIAILSVILVLLIVHIVLTGAREFASLRKEDDGRRRDQSLRALEGIAESWNDAFRLAGEALNKGDIYRAIWITHRILLSILDRAGQIRFVRWKTNSDYIRECAIGADGAAALRELTNAYERVIYAHGDFDCAHAGELLAQVRQLAVKAGS
ncbi:MAG TPA: DUF4129 domain-containing protein [Terriglobia bacterium]|jgi:hypothetical protein